MGWNSKKPDMDAASRVKDCLPDPPTPMSRACPPAVRKTRQMRDRCFKTYLNYLIDQLIRSTVHFSMIVSRVGESLEEDEIQPGLVGVVVVDDVAGDDLVQLRDVGHFSVGPLFW